MNMRRWIPSALFAVLAFVAAAPAADAERAWTTTTGEANYAGVAIVNGAPVLGTWTASWVNATRTQ